MQDAVSVAIDCGGVGFQCFASMNTLKNIGKVGDEATLFTHLNVREGAIELFGFHSNEELVCFRQLITVSGVGPKAGMAVLSVLSPHQLALAVATGDVKSITQAQGVGPKIGQRIVLELKGKLSDSFYADSDGVSLEAAGVASASGNAAEAVSALVILGYTQSEASVAVAKLDSSLTVEDLIKQALKSLTKF